MEADDGLLRNIEVSLKRYRAVESLLRQYQAAVMRNGGVPVPDPLDMTISKRTWESQLFHFRVLLRNLP
jgi:hypothetical protein